MTDTEILDGLIRHVRASYQVTDNLQSRAVLEAVHDWIVERRAERVTPLWKRFFNLNERRT